jgi:hypothetical protein
VEASTSSHTGIDRQLFPRARPRTTLTTVSIDLALLWRQYHVGLSLLALTLALATAVLIVPWWYDRGR